jgi:hypothetical protein
VQVDLTDDFVVMALFGDGAWEDRMQRLQVGKRGGTLHFLVSCMSAMNPCSASFLHIPALLLYKDEVGKRGGDQSCYGHADCMVTIGLCCVSGYVTYVVTKLQHCMHADVFIQRSFTHLTTARLTNTAAHMSPPCLIL